MSWGLELWDQYEKVSSHTHQGLQFLESISQFIKERSAIEIDYASRLRKLVKNYQPKKKDDEESMFSAVKGFCLMMNEINDIAGQHELIAENLTSCIVKEISSFIKELKEERKRLLLEGSKLHSNLQSSYTSLEKSKKAYEKTFREAEKANENFEKADADLHLSRAEVEKAKTQSILKSKLCEDCKTDYAKQLQKTNDLQRQHFSELLPKVFEQLQDMDERRITSIQNYIKKSADVHRQVLPIVNKCLDGISKASEHVDPKKDTQLVIEKYKSGFLPPEDFPFEDLSTLKNFDNNSTVGTLPSYKNDTIRGTLSAGKLKKRGGIFGIFSSNKHNFDELKDDYSELPPNQRRKKLVQRIDSIKHQISQETSTRDGILRLKGSYEQNSALGDPHTLERELAECGNKIEKLQADLQKFQGYLAEAESQMVTPNMQKRNRNSLSEGSLSRSASESSVTNQNNNKTSAPGTPHATHNNPESGLGTSHTSIPDEDGEFDNCDETDEAYEVDPLPALGRAKALYPFDAQSEGSIPMDEAEDFYIVEVDQGDGWTRVRRENMEEGFVPTSYLECFMYNSC